MKLELTADEVRMLIESLDAVGWNASYDGKDTGLGRRARKLREKLVAELRHVEEEADVAAH